MNEKRLYRAHQGRMLAGVCAGVANYFQIDPTLIRLGWVLFCILGGSGVLAYLIAAVIIPDEPY
jgi:phage shock protein C